MFVDFKPGFDTVNRECLCECLERRGLSKKLIAAVREIYRETVNSVRVEGVESEERIETGVLIKSQSFCVLHKRYITRPNI